MRIDVALVPAEAKRWGAAVHVVLDELRASSTIVGLLDRGATAVIPAASLAEARRIARGLGSVAVLVGEHHVVRAPGFDFGNSPAEIAQADLAGRTAVLSTRNGTAVLARSPADATILSAACSTRRPSPARLPLDRRRAADVGIVCAVAWGPSPRRRLRRGGHRTGLLAAAGSPATCYRDGWIDPARQRRRTAAATDAIVLTDAVLAALQLCDHPDSRPLPGLVERPTSPRHHLRRTSRRACDRRQRRRAGVRGCRPPRIEPFAG